MIGRTHIREWAPALLSLATVLSTVVFALSRTAEVSDEIRNMDELAQALDERAEDALRTVRSPGEIVELESRHADFESRLADSSKPGVVVSQLSEAGRNAGLQVLEIQPISSSPSAERPVVYPQYRVSLRGEYQQIASYLEGCKSQRVPVRVVGFEVRRFEEEKPESHGDDLRADIVVESFQSPARQGAS